MEQRTNIQIEHKTLEKLKKSRITKRETYDEIINRLMKLEGGKKMNEELVRKKLEELFERDAEKVGFQFALEFYEKNKRMPNDKEMLICINKGRDAVAKGFKFLEEELKKKE